MPMASTSETRVTRCTIQKLLKIACLRILCSSELFLLLDMIKFANDLRNIDQNVSCVHIYRSKNDSSYSKYKNENDRPSPSKGKKKYVSIPVKTKGSFKNNIKQHKVVT